MYFIVFFSSWSTRYGMFASAFVSSIISFLSRLYHAAMPSGPCAYCTSSNVITSFPSSIKAFVALFCCQTFPSGASCAAAARSTICQYPIVNLFVMRGGFFSAVLHRRRRQSRRRRHLPSLAAFFHLGCGGISLKERRRASTK